MSDINPKLRLAQEIADLLWQRDGTWEEKHDALHIARILLPLPSLITTNVNKPDEQQTEQEIV